VSVLQRPTSNEFADAYGNLMLMTDMEGNSS